MASTNKTTHYELSQYVGTDKPTYLTDYNGDMLAIDTGIYNAQTKADTAFANAGIADGKAVSAQGDATTALNSAGTANTNIGTMTNLSTTDKTSLVGAINENTTNIATNATNIANFNLTNYTTYDYQDMTTDSGTLFHASTITVATNSDGSLAKIYGQILIQNANINNPHVSFQTSLRPSSEIVITGNVLSYSPNQAYFGNLTIKTTGEVVIDAGISTSETINKLFVWNSLLFVKDFGDVPTPQA